MKLRILTKNVTNIFLLFVLFFSSSSIFNGAQISREVNLENVNNLSGLNIDQDVSILSKTSITGFYQHNTPMWNKTEEAFDGYNLFSLVQTDPKRKTPENRSLLITNMEGELIRPAEDLFLPKYSWISREFKIINSTTLLFATNKGATLRNIYDNTTVHMNFWGHHEFEYNPVANTFFTFQYHTVEIEGTKYNFDIITEHNTTGHIIWSLDTRSFLSPTQWCPFQEDYRRDSRDITHSNSLFFDVEEDVFYYHPRNLNTFYKIDHKTGQVLWGLGEHGNFTLFDHYGNQKHALFYHAHAVEKVDDHTFILFDNDKHNQTNPWNQRSRLVEITINETTMTANESWTWTAPPDYYSGGYGDADRLPNGNRLGVFGAEWHPDSTLGARLVEVNGAGEIVWELAFPNSDESAQSVYRMERIRLTPILSSPPDIQALTVVNTTIEWQTWYNVRMNRQMWGSYTLYLNNDPIEHGPHLFNKFWRPSNLTVNLGKLEPGDYNLTLVLSDEAGHFTTDSLNISITPFYLKRDDPGNIEHGHEDAFIRWRGITSRPLSATLLLNNTLFDSFNWNGTIISLDLNLLDIGTYLVTLQMYDYTKIVYDETVLTTIYPPVAPLIHNVPKDQSRTWNESFALSWDMFDHSPASWSIYMNNSHIITELWEVNDYHLNWNVPLIVEGRYNVTLVAYDQIGHQNSKTLWLTVIPPSPPIITKSPHQTEIQWGYEPVFLNWEVHGGTFWKLWKNGTESCDGIISNNIIRVLIANWTQNSWLPGMYNLTLWVYDENGATASHTNWFRVVVNFGDTYVDAIIAEESRWYWDGKQVLGPPDNLFTRLYFDYGNGHVTLDMGVDEEILDGNGIDFTVFSRGGEYMVFCGNNLSAPVVIGNQIEAPLVLIGEGYGNTNFDLADIGLSQARYIQIVYLAGEEVEIDAVIALYFNRPPSPAPSSAQWRVPLLSGLLLLSTIVILWIRKRKKRT